MRDAYSEMNINVEVIIMHEVMWQVAVTPTGAVGATKGEDIAVTERCVARWRHHTLWRHVTGAVGTLQWQESGWQGYVILYGRQHNRFSLSCADQWSTTKLHPDATSSPRHCGGPMASLWPEVTSAWLYPSVMKRMSLRVIKTKSVKDKG